VTSHPVQAAIVAIAFVIFGLVALAIVWSGDWAYAALAGMNGVDSAVFVNTGLLVDRIPLDELLRFHREWAAYVIGLAGNPPRPHVMFEPSDFQLFSPDEYRHMADVRDVFRGAETAGVLAVAVAAFRVVRTQRRAEALRLVRDSALVAAGLVAVVGLAAAVAFEPMFLLFHRVFFPQGNFLFPPESNLIRLYPEWYWQGITAGVGGSFIAIALVAAAAAHIALRRAATTYTRAG
jgi:hypothetical protein